jgi:hypothetical protein
VLDVRFTLFPLQTGVLLDAVAVGVWLTVTATVPAAEVQPLSVAVTL